MVAARHCVFAMGWRCAEATTGVCCPQGGVFCLGSFQITPASFALEPGERMQLQVAFAPTTAGVQSHTVWLTCDNGSTATYQLVATGTLISSHWQFSIRPQHTRVQSVHLPQLYDIPMWSVLTDMHFLHLLAIRAVCMVSQSTRVSQAAC